MSYTSLCGCSWAEDRVHLITARPGKNPSQTRYIFTTVAKFFNGAGQGNPTIDQIIQRLGGGYSRGQILREVNAIEKVFGLWTITNRGGGQFRGMTFTAVGWGEPAPEGTQPRQGTQPDGGTQPDEGTQPQAKSKATDSASPNPAPATDSEAESHLERKKGRKEGRKVQHPSGVAGAAKAAPPQPDCSTAGPAEQGEEFVIKRKPLAQLAVDAWNKVAQDSKLVAATRPIWGLLGKALKHPSIAQDLEKWQAYCRWVEKDRWLGGHDSGRGADLTQACQDRFIERWADKTAKQAARSSYTCEPDPIDDPMDAWFEQAYGKQREAEARP
jgi:hypothetical protein